MPAPPSRGDLVAAGYDRHRTESQIARIGKLRGEINGEIDLLYEIREQITDQISRLNDDRQRAILRYHYLDGRSLAQIADILDISSSTVKRLHNHAVLWLSRKIR